MLKVVGMISVLLIQQVRAPAAVLNPDTAHVGDVVSVAFRIDAPAGSMLLLPDTLVLGENFENAARARIRTDTLENGTLRFTAIYSIVGWRPGEGPIPAIEGTLRTASGHETVRVQPPPITIASVLPADTAGIQPRPLKDVVGPVRVWWMVALALAVLLTVIALGLWWWLRNRGRNQAVSESIPALPPREVLLRELDEIAASALRQGDLRLVYIRLSFAIRRYMATLDPDWGEDLTTRELAEGARDTGIAPALELLAHADLVKFARHAVTAEEAQRDLAMTRRWAETYRPQDRPDLVEAA